MHDISECFNEAILSRNRSDEYHISQPSNFVRPGRGGRNTPNVEEAIREEIKPRAQCLELRPFAISRELAGNLLKRTTPPNRVTHVYAVPVSNVRDESIHWLGIFFPF
jgi:hypothetical protein